MKRILNGGFNNVHAQRTNNKCAVYSTCSGFAYPGSGSLNQSNLASRRTHRRPRTAIFFPGQGVQKVGMLGPWLKAFPSTAGPLVEEIDDLMGNKFSKIIEEGPNSLLSTTVNAQPAVMVCSILILRILEKIFDFRIEERADFVLGHSLGEFAALVAAGNVHFQDSLYLILQRAEVMVECTRKIRAEYGGEYGMIALVTEPGKLTPLVDAIREFLSYGDISFKSEHIEDVSPIQLVQIANINSKNQIVLSGNIERINRLLTSVRQIGNHELRAVRLKSDCPFHSPIMIPAKKAMQRMLEGKSRVKYRENKNLVIFPGKLDCISNISARPFQSEKDLKDLWARSCVDTVRWWDSIKYLDQEQHVRRWIGIGPGKVGRNLVGKEVGMRGKDPIKGGGVWAITDPRDCEEVLRALDDTDSLYDDI
ncbi:malonyl CoA-acyl carrier protein-like protein transacylase [Erysiphe pulchra]|uniref:[acyl-carrier-protein] S-malonyltransferase n=1 Tax=Erysiphe pulchra TaxID=225359 RepID=A0A2S4PJ30_9PEZI|nr:malonyl CoA-acyl carrier protein-like protein transacylase [Erysiphe pulchra]